MEENKDINELREMLELDEDIKFTKKMNQKMNQKLTKKVMKIMSVFIIFCLLAVFGTKMGMESYYYDPNKEDVKYESIFQAYLWTYCPTTLFYSMDIEEKGFSRYDISIRLEKMNEYAAGEHVETLTLYKSVMDMQPLYNFEKRIADEFVDVEKKEYKNDLSLDEHQKEELMKKIKELPESAIIEASVSFTKKKTLHDFLNYKQDYENTQFAWLAMEQAQYVQNGITGIPLFMGVKWNDEKVDELYPAFYHTLDKEYDAKDLKDFYLDILKLLIDHPIAYKTLNGNDVNTSISKIQEQYAFALDNEIQTIGARIFTNKHDFLAMLEKNEITQIMIQDVKLSLFSR